MRRSMVFTNKSGFRLRGRRYRLVSGAEDGRPGCVLGWAETHDENAPKVVPAASGVMGVWRFARHLVGSLLMSTNVGAEAHALVENTLAEKGLESYRRLVHRFEPTSAQGCRLNLMSKVPKSPMGKVDNRSFE